MLTKESILAKTHYGTGIYSHILRQFYPGQTVMHITGRDCGYCRNPWHCDEPTLHIWIEKLHPEQKLSDELSHHEDLMGYIEPGDCFDFAARYWELEGQPLLDKINEELHLHLEDGYCAYEYQKKYIKPTGPLFSLFDAPITNTRPAAEVYLRDIQTRQMDSYGEYIVASVRRMGLSTFRIILILTALRIPETGELSPTLYCTNEDFRTALKICDCIIVHIDKVFSQLPTVEENSGATPVSESTRQLQFSDTLPESFDRKEYLRLAQSLGIPTPSADRYVKKWLEEGRLEKVEHGKYRKSTQ